MDASIKITEQLEATDMETKKTYTVYKLVVVIGDVSSKICSFPQN